MNKKERAERIILELEKKYPLVPELFLDYKTKAQMLCSIILSAQSTDVQVNVVTKKLFKKYKTVADFANATKSDFEKEIFSTGFYKNKTKNVISCFKKIETNFGGKIPKTMPDLVSLPGVGRKTANLVLLSLGKVEGIAVDVHVFRLSKRFGLTTATNPNKAENDLISIYPQKYWHLVNRLFISHGRAVCVAKRPFCSNCLLNKKKLCPRIGVLDSR